MKTKIITFIQIIVLIILSSLVASNLGWISIASGQAAIPTVSTKAEGLTSIVFVTSGLASLDTNVQSSVTSAWNQAGLLSASDIESFYVLAQDAKHGTVIYIDNQGLSALDTEWLQEKYKNGVAFVGVGLPLSDLGKKLGTNPTVPDLDMAYSKGRIQVSICYEYVTDQESGGVFYTDFWSDITYLPNVVEQTITQTPK
jgi:hypothetical protein